MTNNHAVDAIKMRAFLRKHYKYERFEGRDTPNWHYSDAVVNSRLCDLAQFGLDLISRHESVTGLPITYTASDVLASS